MTPGPLELNAAGFLGGGVYLSEENAVFAEVGGGQG